MAIGTQSGVVCRRCGERLQAGQLACPQCRALVNAEQLDGLAAQAKTLESAGDLKNARATWAAMLPLLPADANQAQYARDRVQHLDWEMSQKSKYEQPNQTGRWAKVLGPLGAAGALLAKSKGLLFLVFKLKFLLSFASFIAVYWAIYGMWFGIGFATLILVHELGHYVDIKRRGLPAELPVFLPGFGAYVKWQGLNVPMHVRAAISLAGPLAGMLGAAFCYGMWVRTGVPVWGALARTTAWINTLNLIPVWQLDGGQAKKALAKGQRLGLMVAALAFAYVLWEPVMLFVALGAGWAAFFAHDEPQEGDWGIAAYWVVLLACLGAVMWATSGAKFGGR